MVNKPCDTVWAKTLAFIVGKMGTTAVFQHRTWAASLCVIVRSGIIINLVSDLYFPV